MNCNGIVNDSRGRYWLTGRDGTTEKTEEFMEWLKDNIYEFIKWLKDNNYNFEYEYLKGEIYELEDTIDVYSNIIISLDEFSESTPIILSTPPFENPPTIILTIYKPLWQQFFRDIRLKKLLEI